MANAIIKLSTTTTTSGLAFFIFHTSLHMPSLNQSPPSFPRVSPSRASSSNSYDPSFCNAEAMANEPSVFSPGEIDVQHDQQRYDDYNDEMNEPDLEDVEFGNDIAASHASHDSKRPASVQQANSAHRHHSRRSMLCSQWMQGASVLALCMGLCIALIFVILAIASSSGVSTGSTSSPAVVNDIMLDNNAMNSSMIMSSTNNSSNVDSINTTALGNMTYVLNGWNEKGVAHNPGMINP